MEQEARKVDMARALNPHECKMAYQEMLNCENGIAVLGNNIDGAPTNPLTSELLEKNNLKVPKYLEEYMVNINKAAPKPGNQNIKKGLEEEGFEANTEKTVGQELDAGQTAEPEVFRELPQPTGAFKGSGINQRVARSAPSGP